MQNIELKLKPLDKSKVMVQVSHESREALADLIDDHYSHSISRLAERIGMHAPNVYNAINGSKMVSLAQIDRILGAIGFTANLGPNNTLIITPLETPVDIVPPAPKSIFDDVPEGTTMETIVKQTPKPGKYDLEL